MSRSVQTSSNRAFRASYSAGGLPAPRIHRCRLSTSPVARFSTHPLRPSRGCGSACLLANSPGGFSPGDGCRRAPAYAHPSHVSHHLPWLSCRLGFLDQHRDPGGRNLFPILRMVFGGQMLPKPPLPSRSFQLRFNRPLQGRQQHRSPLAAMSSRITAYFYRLSYPTTHPGCPQRCRADPSPVNT